MQPTLILSAVPREIALLTDRLTDPVAPECGMFPALAGSIDGIPLVCCAGGIGKANAAAAAVWLIERYQPGRIIVTGCGGAYPGSGLSVGDLAVASDEIFGDEGAYTPGGWLDLQQMGLALLSSGERHWYNTIPLARLETEQVMRSAGNHGLRLVRGRFITVSACSGTKTRGLELAHRHQAICENMEGAAVALIALRYRIPCLELRGISNLVEDRDMSRWNIDFAVATAQRFVLKVIELLGTA